MKIFHRPEIDDVSIDFNEGKVKYRKPNGKDYRFKRRDILKRA